MCTSSTIQSAPVVFLTLTRSMCCSFLYCPFLSWSPKRTNFRMWNFLILSEKLAFCPFQLLGLYRQYNNSLYHIVNSDKQLYEYTAAMTTISGVRVLCRFDCTCSRLTERNTRIYYYGSMCFTAYVDDIPAGIK